MGYAVAADLSTRYDTNRLGDLVNDDGTTATATQLLTHPVVAALLDDASGLVDSACLAGRKYLPEDLTDLTGFGLNLLIRLTCDLTFGLLVERRGYEAGDLERLAPQYGRALQYLDALRSGDRIFGDVVKAAAAGLPVLVKFSDRINLLSGLASRLMGAPADTYGTN